MLSLSSNLWIVVVGFDVDLDELWDFVILEFCNKTHTIQYGYDTGRDQPPTTKWSEKNADDETTTRHDYLLWLKCAFFTLLNHLLVWSRMLSLECSFDILRFPSSFIHHSTMCVCVWCMCLEYWWYVTVYSLNLHSQYKSEALNCEEGWKRHWCKRYQKRFLMLDEDIREHIAFCPRNKTNVCL